MGDFKWLALLAAGTFVPSFAAAETELSLEELLATEIKVASVNSSTLRESPGIVSLVTAEEIKRSGARDLIDVLRLVPGFDFGVDVQGVVGVGIRGNWAHEGKISLRVDGMEMNELLYSGLAFGHHFPVDNIKRIEIIRGPGSAIYGGYAELAVINIVTKDAQDHEGATLQGVYGRRDNGLGRQAVSLRYADRVADDVAYSVYAMTGRGQRAERSYVDLSGAETESLGQTDLDPTLLQASLDAGGFRLRALVDQYKTRQVDELIVAPVSTDFITYSADASYEAKLAENFSLVPRVALRRQWPWKEPLVVIDTSTASLEYYKSVDRYTGELQLKAQPVPALELVGGFTYDYDLAKDRMDSLSFNGENEVHYSNRALYAQVLLRTPIADITAGGRHENHTQYGKSFVPRLALVKVIDRWHFKVLGSRAFRAPGVENIQLNPAIEPEETTVLEVETGYQAGRSFFVSANLFDIKIEKPIVYFIDVFDVEHYLNFDRVATQGAEVEGRWNPSWGSLTANYSFYRVKDNQVSRYAVPSRGDVLLGFPAHKATAQASVALTEKFSVNPSVVYWGDRYAFAFDPGAGGPAEKKVKPQYLANLYLLWEEVLPGLDLGAGVFNLFDEDVNFPQPYDGGHAPLPDAGREYLARVTYRF